MVETLPAGCLSAVGATEMALANIDKWNPHINAMLTVTAEDALRAAEELDVCAKAGGWGGILHGMTISLKDNVDMAGVPTTAASRILADNVAAKDAFIVERLRRNGAVIVGKANLHEWVFGPLTQSKHFGPCFNPWNTKRVPGGSSGGSGASVASGMCVASIGSDTGGSIRLPAALNGVAGLRPTIGRISGGGSVHVSQLYDTLGPLAYRVADVARVFAAIAGHDPDDPISEDRPVQNFLPDLTKPVAGLRLGISRRWFFEDIDPDLSIALEEALQIYRELDVEIIELDLGDVERSHPLMAFTVLVADAYERHAEQISRRREDYGEDVLERFMLGREVTGQQYAEALRWMEGWRHRLRNEFGKVDAIISPTSPFTAVEAGDTSGFLDKIRKITRYTYAWSFAGVPALSVPCGFARDGLPLGMQIASPWFEEPTVLKLGHAYQGTTDHHLKRPRLPT